MKKVFLPVFLLFSINLIAQNKKPLDHSVYDGWKAVGERMISNDGKYIESFLRSKFDLSYYITKKIKTSLSEELRFQLHDPRNDEADYGLRRFRHCLGIDYDISSKSTVGAYYLIQNEITTYKPNELYIFGLQYSFQL